MCEQQPVTVHNFNYSIAPQQPHPPKKYKTRGGNKKIKNKKYFRIKTKIKSKPKTKKTNKKVVHELIN